MVGCFGGEGSGRIWTVGLIVVVLFFVRGRSVSRAGPASDGGSTFGVVGVDKGIVRNLENRKGC